MEYPLFPFYPLLSCKKLQIRKISLKILVEFSKEPIFTNGKFTSSEISKNL